MTLGCANVTRLVGEKDGVPVSQSLAPDLVKNHLWNSEVKHRHAMEGVDSNTHPDPLTSLWPNSIVDRHSGHWRPLPKCEAPVFASGTAEFELHPEIESRRTAAWKGVVKQYGSVYTSTDLAGWLRQHNIDTVTLVGYMTNNCVLASAVEAEFVGFTTEVLSDATGAINIANDAGFVDAKTVHTTLMALLNSNWAAVSTTDAWADALATQQVLTKSDLGSSAMAGAARLTRA
jgi:nicotinamidase-related amidase